MSPRGLGDFSTLKGEEKLRAWTNLQIGCGGELAGYRERVGETAEGPIGPEGSWPAHNLEQPWEGSPAQSCN
jgi:hypothetical protein